MFCFRVLSLALPALNGQLGRAAPDHRGRGGRAKAVGRWQAPSRPDPLLELGARVALLPVGMAWSREAGGQRPASRYTDIRSLGVMVNGIARCILVRDSGDGRHRNMGRRLTSVWLPWHLVGLGCDGVVRKSLPT